MKQLLSSVAVLALMTVALPAWAQSSTSQPSTNQMGAGAATSSHPGEAGMPGNKNGPSAKEPSGSSSAGSGSSTSGSGTSNSNAPLQDPSKVQGMPGNKSGPSVRQPGQGSNGGTSTKQ